MMDENEVDNTGMSNTKDCKCLSQNSKVYIYKILKDVMLNDF
jgi:hypothetical protein